MEAAELAKWRDMKKEVGNRFIVSKTDANKMDQVVLGVEGSFPSRGERNERQ